MDSTGIANTMGAQILQEPKEMGKVKGPKKSLVETLGAMRTDDVFNGQEIPGSLSKTLSWCFVQVVLSFARTSEGFAHIALHWFSGIVLIVLGEIRSKHSVDAVSVGLIDRH